MSAALLAPAVQVCSFALGCALIHALRDRPDLLSRLLGAAALAAAAAVLITAAVIWAPRSRAYPGEVATYAAVAGHPPETQ